MLGLSYRNNKHVENVCTMQKLDGSLPQARVDPAFRKWTPKHQFYLLYCVLQHLIVCSFVCPSLCDRT